MDCFSFFVFYALLAFQYDFRRKIILETARQCLLSLIVGRKGKGEGMGILQKSPNINSFYGLLSDWFYSELQREPRKRKKDCRNYVAPTVLLQVDFRLVSLFQCDAAYRGTFLCIGNFGVHLCRCHILVTEITLHYGNACPCVQLETGKAVA